jgi:hypothetical protein
MRQTVKAIAEEFGVITVSPADEACNGPLLRTAQASSSGPEGVGPSLRSNSALAGPSCPRLASARGRQPVDGPSPQPLDEGTGGSASR